MTELEIKLQKLMKWLEACDSVVVAFSGGVDSTFLAAAAAKALGDKAIAVTAYSETLSRQEEEDARTFAAQIGIRHVLLPISELDSSEFTANTKERCYHCKKTRFVLLSEWAEAKGYQWILEGSNADDVHDYRPGMRAVQELEKVCSPLLEQGITKEEIRQLSKEWGLPTWDKPSAACLSSRVAYGLTITAERLKQVELAETVIKKFCHGQIRVRHHGDIARIEVEPKQVATLAEPEVAQKVSAALKEIGFSYVALDLNGYRMGSMNTPLSLGE